MKPYFDDQFNLFYSITPDEKTILLSDYSELYNKYELFAEWMNDTAVPVEQKLPYEDMLIRAMHNINLVQQVMTRCGITREEIAQYQKIPF